MRRPKLGFSQYADQAILFLAEFILVSLTGNIYYPVLTPTLAEFQTTINDYSAALSAAEEGGKTNISNKKASKKALIAMLRALAICVMNLAGTNESALVSSGFPLTKTPTPKGPMGIPVIAKKENGVSSGEVQVTLNALPGALVFVVQYTQDPLTADSVWLSQNSTSVKVVLSDLELGKRYWIKVVAYGTNDQMMTSDPVLTRIVQ